MLFEEYLFPSKKTLILIPKTLYHGKWKIPLFPIPDYSQLFSEAKNKSHWTIDELMEKLIDQDLVVRKRSVLEKKMAIE
jgi:hypothetical protein